MIRRAHREAEPAGLALWNEDEAGPYQAIPQPGSHWAPEGKPERVPHEYIRGGTAKIMTLFHPATGQVRLRGVESVTNAVLHPWIQEQISQILASLPEREAPRSQAEYRAEWESWQAGLSVRFTLLHELPPLRMLLIWDNLAGHHSAELLCWLMSRGVMVLFTPLGGSWLNLAESVQRILVRRALSGTHPKGPQEIIGWLEAVARGWNRDPTPFQWGGRRKQRRDRARFRRHAVGGSAACTRRPIRRASRTLDEWRRSCQLTH
ncbi:MAG: hypothetical protein AB1941_08520 [Gemmatimonadota bacterium]